MESTEYMVMFPFMAQGHLIPFMELAKLFSNRTHLIITLVSTPLNTQNLASLLPPTTTIRLQTLPFNSSDHGLPPNSENTDALPSFHYNSRLSHASQTLRPSFEALLADLSRRYGRPPLFVVADVVFGWTVEVARNLGIYHAFFTTSGAYGAAAFFSLWLNLPHTKTDSDEFSVPGFPETFRLSRSQMSVYMRAADGTDTWSAFFQEQLKYSCLSDGMLCNTVEEMEETGLKILRQMLNIPVWSIGPLLPPSLLQRSSPSAASSLTAGARAGKEPGISATRCVEWLNLHPPSSVLYISFGSENTISATQLMQLALGLEAAGRPFIWVLRPPLGHDVAGEFREEWLPPGFESRASERKQGILVRRWAPQLEILSHQSTGAFISHCGWNSVLESLSQGVPIIGWPLAADQFYNSKMMEEELGVCVEVARGIADEVTSERVERVVAVVLGGRDKGEEMKRKAAEIAEMVNASVRDEAGRRGSSVEAVDDFLRTARSKREGGSHPSIFDKLI